MIVLVLGATLEASTPTPTPIPSPTPAVEEVVVDHPPGWGFSFSEEGVVRTWRDDPKSFQREDFSDGMSRFYALATRPHVELGLQVDGAIADPNGHARLIPAIPARPGWTTGVGAATPPGARTAATILLEKKFARLRSDSASVEAGDAYRSLGRGMALALIKNSDLDIDTSIEGASADLTLDAIEASAWAGYSNPQTLEVGFPNRLDRDVRDEIGGARVQVNAAGMEAGLFGNALVADPKVPALELINAGNVRVNRGEAAGASFSIPDLFGKGDLYVEGVQATYRTVENATHATLPGFGWYGAATAYAGPVTILAEGKRYKNMEVMNLRQGGTLARPYDYSTPPTLEKENVVTLHTTEAVNSNDIAGGRLSASVKAGAQVVNLVYARFEDMGEPFDFGTGSIVHDDQHVNHAYAGVERRTEGFYFQATAGYRYETRMNEASQHNVLTHADADLLMPVGKGMSVEGKYLVYRQVEYQPGPFSDFKTRYDVSSLVASFRPARWLAVAGYLDTTTDARVLTPPFGHEGNLSKYTFGALELTVEPNDRSTVRLFGGATQGGLKCSGGTCRTVPAFNGVRGEWLVRF